MIIRIFTGASWTAATQLEDAPFDIVPREGEKLALVIDGQWKVATVKDVAHRVAGEGAADVALLVGPVRESPLGDEALPLAALDGDEPITVVPGVPPTTRGSPWRR
jgi:hypothetical protein